MTTHIEAEIQKAQDRLAALRKKQREADRRAADKQARDIGRRLQRAVPKGKPEFVDEAKKIIAELWPADAEDSGGHSAPAVQTREQSGGRYDHR